MSVGQRFDALNLAVKAKSLRAPVSDHHWRAVSELLPWIEPLGLRTALEIGAGEPPYLVARMLEKAGLAVHTLDAVSDCSLPGDAHDLPCADNSFDLVCARHVLEHVLCPPLVLSEMARVTTRYLLVVTPWDSPKARDWPDHLWHLGREGWERLFLKAGLTVVRYAEGDHTEQYAIDQGLWQDKERRYLLVK